MPAVQQWGRKESLIWPPRGFYYTYGAIFLAIVTTGFLIYAHYRFASESAPFMVAVQFLKDTYLHRHILCLD